MIENNFFRIVYFSFTASTFSLASLANKLLEFIKNNSAAKHRNFIKIEKLLLI